MFINLFSLVSMPRPSLARETSPGPTQEGVWQHEHCPTWFAKEIYCRILPSDATKYLLTVLATILSSCLNSSKFISYFPQDEALPLIFVCHRVASITSLVSVCHLSYLPSESTSKVELIIVAVYNRWMDWTGGLD